MNKNSGFFSCDGKREKRISDLLKEGRGGTQRAKRTPWIKLTCHRLALPEACLTQTSTLGFSRRLPTRVPESKGLSFSRCLSCHRDSIPALVCSNPHPGFSEPMISSAPHSRLPVPTDVCTLLTPGEIVVVESNY